MPGGTSSSASRAATLEPTPTPAPTRPVEGSDAVVRPRPRPRPRRSPEARSRRRVVTRPALARVAVDPTPAVEPVAAELVPPAPAVAPVEAEPTAGGETPAAENPEVSALDAPAPDRQLLVERAQDGDADAFAEIYELYVDTVFRYIYYRTTDRVLAEDLTSETFLRAWKRIDSFTWQGRDIGAWLVRIARNLLYDVVKSSRYRLEVTTAELAEPTELAPDTTEGQVLAADTASQLLAGIAQLSPEQQECVVLRFFEGLSVAETAEVMGRREGAVKALQHRAVRRLGTLLPHDLAS